MKASIVTGGASGIGLEFVKLLLEDGYKVFIIDNNKKKEALEFLPSLNSALMKVAKTGIIKKQNASRNISRITKKINAL